MFEFNNESACVPSLDWDAFKVQYLVGFVSVFRNVSEYAEGINSV
jgi:hypothetical protein